MNKSSATYKYLKGYEAPAIAVLITILAASLFDGASLGALIPLIQSFTNAGGNVLNNVPLLNRIAPMFASQSQGNMLLFTLAILFLILILKNAFTYISNILMSRLRFTLIRDLSVKAMDKLLGYDMKYFDGAKSGHIIATVSLETGRIGSYTFAVLRFVAVLCRVLVYIGLLFLISFKASTVVFILIALVLLPLEIIVKKLKNISGAVSLAQKSYHYKLTEILNGIRLIKISGAEGLEKESFSAEAKGMADLGYQSNRLTGLLIPVAETAIFGLITFCFFIIVKVIGIDTASAFPFIAAYLVILVHMLTQLNLLNSLRAEAVSYAAAFRNYEELCDERGKKTLIDGQKVIGRFSGSLRFNMVNFSYVEDKKVLNDMDFTIPAGKITAIVGVTGVGKSTILNLILRFYDADSGEITVGGVNIRDLRLKDWRKKIGYVSQDIFIFNTSAAENISYGSGDVTGEKVIEAARRAHAHEFIMEMPQKYETVLGERGVKLSGGQKQRISIARAILRDPEILILDEATSSLDTETEKMIKMAMDDITKGRTVIVIAHRLSSVVNADNIIVLDRGMVVEHGPHAELVGRNGIYKRLYESQLNV